MALEYAIDELYATGWQALDSSACTHLTDGRPFPTEQAIKDAFAHAGFDLSIRRIQLFDCSRAEWRDASGSPIGAVVGQTHNEAAVFALAQLRRQMQPVH